MRLSHIGIQIIQSENFFFVLFCFILPSLFSHWNLWTRINPHCHPYFVSRPEVHKLRKSSLINTVQGILFKRELFSVNAKSFQWFQASSVWISVKDCQNNGNIGKYFTAVLQARSQFIYNRCSRFGTFQYFCLLFSRLLKQTSLGFITIAVTTAGWSITKPLWESVS